LSLITVSQVGPCANISKHWAHTHSYPMFLHVLDWGSMTTGKEDECRNGIGNLGMVGYASWHFRVCPALLLPIKNSFLKRTCTKTIKELYRVKVFRIL